MQTASSSGGQAIERTHMTDDLLGASQKIPNWLAKIAFLGKLETASKSSIKSRFGVLGFSISDSIWGLWFFL